MDTSISGASPGHTPTASQPPTPELSPGTTSVDPMESTGTPCQMPNSGFSSLPLDPRLTQPSVSSFTSELPNEVKTMANIDMNDPMAMPFFGEGMLPMFPGPDGHDGEASSLRQFDPNIPESYGRPHPPDAYCESFPSSLDPPLMGYSKVPQSDGSGQLETSTCEGVGHDNWESLINFDLDQ
ncbi:hypothetical protein SAMD00023353_9300340 [Rosellinia necatrix]|uniref:Uncharacterized protein n=1 Tax=Rosellinia necatrix TaxID=77044 RepID=A0A1S8AAY2_ROSNE|nr:hypothetical protein SAMD00023353_9300340 [Rosellinia necatrix]